MIRTILLLITLGTLLISCSDSEYLNLGDGDDVTVTLEILDSKGIEKIEFQRKHSPMAIATANSTDIREHRFIRFSCENKGEGTIEVRVITKKDTLTREMYVENGYHEHLECTASKLEYVNSNSGLY